MRFVAQVGPEPLQMAGPVDLIAAVGSSAESLHLMAKLIDLDPDGHAVRICDGAALVHGGWPATVRVDMGDVGYVIRPGQLAQT